MPSYELTLITKCMDRPQTVQALKRVGKFILEKGGFIKSLENLGEMQAPYRLKRGGGWRARYVIYHVEAPISLLAPLQDVLERDLDVVRGYVQRKEVMQARPCETHPCDFGELTDEMRARNRLWVKQFMKQL